MPTVLIHIMNEDPVVGEVDKLPESGDTLIIVKNPRRRAGKALYYLEANVSAVVWPMHRLVLIEIMPSTEDEEIIGFVREK